MMPRVEFLVDVAGPGESYTAGQVVDMTGEQAKAWADGERAQLVRDEPPATPERRGRRPERTDRGGGAEQT